MKVSIFAGGKIPWCFKWRQAHRFKNACFGSGQLQHGRLLACLDIAVLKRFQREKLCPERLLIKARDPAFIFCEANSETESLIS